MKKNSIFIVTYEPFPIGMAATNRILSWSKALVDLESKITILILKPTEKDKNTSNQEFKGISNGVYFEYLNGFTVWNKDKSIIFKASLLIKSHLKLIAKILKENPGTIITYSPFLYTKLFLIACKVLLNYKLVIEETEYPKILKRKSNRLSKYAHLSTYKFADGMIVMTKELEYFFKNKLGVENLFHLPMTVDLDRFTNIVRDNRKSDYFIYVGGQGGFVRDGLDDIISAFIMFSQTTPGYSLWIVGNLDKNSNAFLKCANIIQESGAEDRILFIGPKLANQIPQLLINSKGIIMAPPKDYSSGGFPTKLGEFLASGRPVICTSVSEIPLYLNNSNSFLVKPGDIGALSESLLTIANKSSHSDNIGKSGQMACKKYFDVKVYAESLLSFLKFSN